MEDSAFFQAVLHCPFHTGLYFWSLMEPFTVASSVVSRVPAQSAPEISKPNIYRYVLAVFLSSPTIVVALTPNFPHPAKGAEPSKTKATIAGQGSTQEGQAYELRRE